MLLVSMNVISPHAENKVIGSNIQPILNPQHGLSVQCTVFARGQEQTQGCVRDRVSVVRLITNMIRCNRHVVNTISTRPF